MKIIESENINVLWANLIIEELIRQGCDYFCISPGSRSSPLTIAVARNPKAKSFLIFDERSAAFHALGYGKAQKKPAVLICTSGTAAANYFPAVIEAESECVPMLIFSADRPPELQETGANQTINQTHLYGNHARWFFNLPCPNEQIDTTFVLSSIDQVFFEANIENPGPVHVNCNFREPLAPEEIGYRKHYLKPLEKWINLTTPFVQYSASTRISKPNEIDFIAKEINDHHNGLIIIGKNDNPDLNSRILKLANKLNWPVFPDITSGLRLKKDKSISNYYDRILLSESLQERLLNIPILHFGGQFVSKNLHQFLMKHTGTHVHIWHNPKRINPQHKKLNRIVTDETALIEFLLKKVNTKHHKTFNAQFLKTNHEIDLIVEKLSDSTLAVNEISAAQIVSKYLEHDSTLFLASSMPIRDYDMYATCSDKNITVTANRGASGIDGTISSALGFAKGSEKPITLHIGDLAFIHDINALFMLKQIEFPITIVLINNQGGGIFSFLPIANHKDFFEKFFGTSHNHTFKQIAHFFNMSYFSPKTNNQLKEDYLSCQKNKKHSLIEIRTQRDENAKTHQQLQAQIKKILP